VAILIVGFVVLLISYIAANKNLSFNYVGLKPSHEAPIGGFLLIVWIVGNAIFGGNRLWSVKMLRHNIDITQQMEFLDFKKSSADNRYFIEEELKEALLSPNVERVFTQAWTYFCCLFTFEEYFKIQKRHRHAARKKFLSKLESRGFEVGGSNANGEFFYDIDSLTQMNRSSILSPRQFRSPGLGPSQPPNDKENNKVNSKLELEPLVSYSLDSTIDSAEQQPPPPQQQQQQQPVSLALDEDGVTDGVMTDSRSISLDRVPPSPSSGSAKSHKSHKSAVLGTTIA
jgi:hypothetical protein